MFRISNLMLKETMFYFISLYLCIHLVKQHLTFLSPHLIVL